MIAGLIAHLLQATLFAGAAWLLTLGLRRNQAQVRYWVWFAASVKFLIPFSLLVGLGALAPGHAPAPASKTGWVAAAEQFGQPLTTLPAVASRFVTAANQANGNYLAAAALALWACGFAAIAICWLRRWKRVHALRRLAARLIIPNRVQLDVPAMSAPGLIEPGIFGIFRPVLLLPEGIEKRLDSEQLDAILAHELCHVRRHDNLTATIHMAVQAIYWFHPLVWWMGARLVDERERACDEEVLRLGGKPHVYAAGILNVCKLYVESPLSCVSGVTGSNLKRRIEAIMKNRIALRLTFTKKAVLIVAGITALAAPIAVGIMNAPAVRAQSRGQSPSSKAAAVPAFEVASIKRCKDGDAGTGGGTKGGKGSGGGPSPGRLTVGCLALVGEDGFGLIHRAYDRFANGHENSMSFLPIVGGPAWIKSERYQINAKAQGDPGQAMMNGPMLQRLLEDRFKLRVHHETRDFPVYALVVAKGGPKLQQFKEGSCVAVDPNADPPTALEPGQVACGGGIGLRKGPNITCDSRRRSLDDFAKLLGFVLDRPVIDKTGIDGLFDFHLAFSPDEATPKYLPGGEMTRFPALPSDDPPAPSIFVVVQEQLGLKLEASKGPREFIVIDSVQRPTGN